MKKLLINLYKNLIIANIYKNKCTYRKYVVVGKPITFLFYCRIGEVFV